MGIKWFFNITVLSDSTSWQLVRLAGKRWQQRQLVVTGGEQFQQRVQTQRQLGWERQPCQQQQPQQR